MEEPRCGQPCGIWRVLTKPLHTSGVSRDSGSSAPADLLGCTTIAGHVFNREGANDAMAMKSDHGHYQKMNLSPSHVNRAERKPAAPFASGFRDPIAKAAKRKHRQSGSSCRRSTPGIVTQRRYRSAPPRGTTTGSSCPVGLDLALLVFYYSNGNALMARETPAILPTIFIDQIHP
jgi:hypothetical protein